MGEILPDGSIQGYENFCGKCGKVIKVNSQGNEIGNHACNTVFGITELSQCLDKLLNHCSMISADKGEEIYNKLMNHKSVIDANLMLKKYLKQ